MSNILAMDTKNVEGRAERGLAIVQSKGKRIRQIVENKYLVPSQTTNSGGYVVDVEAGTCSCPDFETRGCRCKHLWAVLIVRHEVEMPDGSSIVTEHRITYRQDWPAYNAAQMDEKSRIEVLLRGLCDGLRPPSSPEKKNGRPPTPLADVVYGAAMKTYIGMSGRRATSDIRSCAARGLMTESHYNTIFRYMERPEVTPVLRVLVEQSALPLRVVENQFAVDSTGFSTSTYARWYDHKYGEEKRTQRYVKAHAIVGTATNVIATVDVTEGYVNDTPMLPALVQRAAKGFNIGELSGDKAYLSHENLAAIASVGAVPFVAFKENSRGESKGSAAEVWRKMWHTFNLERDTFLQHYHRRSNVESTFSAVKRLFDASVRAKGTVAQFNEVYLKCLCFNLTCLVHAIHELGLNPKFWCNQEVA